ncbi:MAG: SRPBCC family protein [Elusimicrobia bacterium]|nr:SRPBCC family protein [Elusimicrobiota bacterium]
MIKIDPKLDLLLERVVDVPRELVWKAWTTPEHLKVWFTPAPWKTVDCSIDLRPGGSFRTVMQSPEGQTFPTEGCYLEIVENAKLVWTSALLPGFRPARLTAVKGHECEELAMTAILLLEPLGRKTKYTAIALHADFETRQRHADMGFADGWGKALDQLVAHMKKAV